MTTRTLSFDWNVKVAITPCVRERIREWLTPRQLWGSRWLSTRAREGSLPDAPGGGGICLAGVRRPTRLTWQILVLPLSLPDTDSRSMCWNNGTKQQLARWRHRCRWLAITLLALCGGFRVLDDTWMGTTHFHPNGQLEGLGRASLFYLFNTGETPACNYFDISELYSPQTANNRPTCALSNYSKQCFYD